MDYINYEDEQKAEALLMQAGQMVRMSEPGRKELDLRALTDALGLSPETAMEIAQNLQDDGYVKLSFVGGEYMRVLPAGWRKLREMRRPSWIRWLDRHRGVKGALLFAAGSVGTLLSSLLLEYLKRFLP